MNLRLQYPKQLPYSRGLTNHRHIAQEGGGFSRSGAGLGFNVAFLFWTVLSVVGDGFELFRRFPCPS
jgi:hypothetical protein